MFVTMHALSQEDLMNSELTRQLALEYDTVMIEQNANSRGKGTIFGLIGHFVRRRLYNRMLRRILNVVRYYFALLEFGKKACRFWQTTANTGGNHA